MALHRKLLFGKLNRYLIELSIIIIGITISFAVQSHLRDSEGIQKQIEAYERLDDDLKADRDYLQQAFEYNELQIESAKAIVSGNLDRVNFNQIITYYGTFFNDNTITSIMSTGLLENFDNQALINDILTYYRRDYDFLTDVVRFDEKIALKNILLLAKEVRIDSISTSSILEHENKTKTPMYTFSDSTAQNLTTNDHFIGLLQSKIWVKFVYNNFINNALERNRAISEEIQRELQSMK